VGFDVYSDVSGTRLGLGQGGSLPALSLGASLEGMATQFFGMKVTASQSWESSPSDIDIYAANESTPPPPQPFRLVARLTRNENEEI